MSDTVLHAQAGRSTGSAASRRLRREDKIPAVVYGQGMDPLSVAVARSELRAAVSGAAGLNTVLDLTVDGASYPVIIKDIERHPVRRTIQHIDFIQVNLSEEITVSVPLRLEGEAKAVLQANALVDLAMAEMDVVTTPRNIPDEIVIDVSEMTVDDVIRVEDIELPSDVVTTADPEATVVTSLFMRVEEEPEPEILLGEDGEPIEVDAEAAEGDTGDDAGDAGDDAGE